MSKVLRILNRMAVGGLLLNVTFLTKYLSSEFETLLRVGGIGNIVDEGKTALLANVEDTSAFCQHLLNLVRNDSLREELSGGSSYYVT